MLCLKVVPKLKKLSLQLLKILKNPTYLSLIIILFIALGLRLYQIDKVVWMQYGYDESRDMLVARHIANYGESISGGPLAAGGMHWLQNSPLYYYFVALLWFFTRDPLRLMYLWAVVMTSPILIGYLIGKKINNEQTGLILASLLAVNSQMVASSRELLQPHLSLIWASLFIYSGISLIKTKKYKLRYLLLTIFFTLLPLHFHYGVLLALPTALIFIIYSWFNLNKDLLKNISKKINKNKKGTLIYQALSPIFLFLGMIMSWILLTYRIFPFDQIYFLIFNFEQNYYISPILQIREAILMINKMTWSYYFSFIGILIFIFALVISISKLINKKKQELKLRKIIIFLLMMSCSVFFFAFYKRFVTETYLLFIFPFFITLLALSLSTFIKHFKIIGWGITLASVLIMASFTLMHSFQNLPINSFQNQQKNTAQTIYDHYQSLNLEEANPQPSLLITWYTTIGNMPFDGWGTSGIWYYLEQFFQKKLVFLTKNSLNHTPINKYPKIIYMVCDHREKPQLIEKECVSRFMKSYPILNNEIDELSSNPEISVWSAKVDPRQNRYIKNVVHQDLIDRN